MPRTRISLPVKYNKLFIIENLTATVAAFRIPFGWLLLRDWSRFYENYNHSTTVAIRLRKLLFRPQNHLYNSCEKTASTIALEPFAILSFFFVVVVVGWVRTAVRRRKFSFRLVLRCVLIINKCQQRYFLTFFFFKTKAFIFSLLTIFIPVMTRTLCLQFPKHVSEPNFNKLQIIFTNFIFIILRNFIAITLPLHRWRRDEKGFLKTYEKNLLFLIGV